MLGWKEPSHTDASSAAPISTFSGKATWAAKCRLANFTEGWWPAKRDLRSFGLGYISMAELNRYCVIVTIGMNLQMA